MVADSLVINSRGNELKKAEYLHISAFNIVNFIIVHNLLAWYKPCSNAF
jgi:hypothetical protein